ncbi:saoe class I histocompatibility antigen, A alpha chain-like [Mantella aurantiaca]
MTPFILIILGVSGVYCDSHSLRYFETAVSSPGSGLPVFSSVGYVDDQEITNYNSDTRQDLPKTEWMKKLGDEYWEYNTQISQRNEAVYKHDVQTLMSRFNQTGGIHIVQEMYGCELRDDGSTEGYMQIGYDGRDFISLDTQNWIFIPTMNEAQITTQRWNSPEMREGERNKNYLENECIDFLKKHINNGREDLEKRVRPEVKVWGRRQSDGVTRLQCLVYGFHPRAVDVKWVRNGVDHLPSEEMTPILPHPDGTYQIRITTDVPTTEGDTYSCHVDHSSLEDETLSVKWDPPGTGLSVGVIAGIVIGIIAVLAIIIAVVLMIRKNKNDYKSANTSDTASDNSKEVKACCPFRLFGVSVYITAGRMEVTPLILIILGVSGVYCDSHSLRYFVTGVSSPGFGLPVFSILGYVDDREISNYNSDTRQDLPKTEWMKKLGDEYWKRTTQIGQSAEPVFKYNVQTAMSRFFQTGGIHIVQRMYGCELRDDGSTAGYDQYGYDGREFIFLDTKTGIYIPSMNEAQISTQRWNSPEERVGERLKNYLENECIDFLKKHINNGREDLEKRVRPEVKVWGRQQSDGVTRLQCLVYGFHPRAVDVKWVRNGVDHLPSKEMAPILPHPDGTYQIRVTVEVPTTEGDTYSCHVDHSSLEDEILIVKWGKNKNDYKNTNNFYRF